MTYEMVVGLGFVVYTQTRLLNVFLEFITRLVSALAVSLFNALLVVGVSHRVVPVFLYYLRRAWRFLPYWLRRVITIFLKVIGWTLLLLEVCEIVIPIFIDVDQVLSRFDTWLDENLAKQKAELAMCEWHLSLLFKTIFFGCGMDLLILREGQRRTVEIIASTAPLHPDFLDFFPYHRVPDDPEERETFRDVYYAVEVLNERLGTVLLPEFATEENFVFWDHLLTSLEVRGDISWFTAEEAGPQRLVIAFSTDYERKAIGVGAKLTEAERSFDERFQFRERQKALKEWHEALKFGSRHPGRRGVWVPQEVQDEARDNGTRIGVPDQWSPLYLEEKLPPFKPTPTAPWTLSLTAEQTEDRESRFKYFNLDRDPKIDYLRDHPPSPLGWAPIRGSSAKKAWPFTDTDEFMTHFKPIWGSLSLQMPQFNDDYPDSSLELKKMMQDKVYRSMKDRVRHEEFGREYKKVHGEPVEEEKPVNPDAFIGPSHKPMRKFELDRITAMIAKMLDGGDL